MNKLYSKTWRLIIIQASFCLVLIFLSWNKILQQVKRDREHTIATAIQRNSNLVVSLEQYAIRTIKNADAVLRLIKLEYEQKGRKIDFNSLYKHGVIDNKNFKGIAIINEKGDLVLNDFNYYPEAHTVLSDREHFKYHITHENDLFLSDPLLSRTINKTVVVLSRRINKPDGSFGGTVALQIEPSSFTQFYSKADLRNDDVISLISTKGITYARRKGKIESSGEDISNSPLFQHVARRPVGNYFARDAIFGIPSFFSYRKLDQYPVIATVGSAREDVLLNFYERANRDYLYGIIVTLMLVLFSVLISAVLVWQRKSDRRVKDSEARYRSIFENSHDGIILLAPCGHIEAINEAAYNLFKVGVADSGQVLFSQLFLHSVPEIDLEYFTHYNEKDLEKEVSFTCLNGSSFIGEIACSVFRDSNNKDQLVINIRDITQRKQIEQHLLKEQKRFQRKLTKQIILAQERERESIGHELHDNVSQILTTVKLYLEMANSNPEMRDQLLPKSIHHILDCISEIRNLSHALSAPTLGTHSLVDSLKALIETVACASGLYMHFEHESYTTSLIKDQKLALYRILQEQLNNIVKHSGATEVSLSLSQVDNKTTLRIRDNGKGFNVHAQRTGIGLNNILSRTKVLGGELKIESSEGKGCTLIVRLPIKADELPEDISSIKSRLGI
ncbi:MAG TPA: ATP-binding protein [Flavisolibacter sp.]|nr:ATP-binding protein [Flavisolibacter sp.]